MAGQLQIVTNLSGLYYPSQHIQCTKGEEGRGRQVASERKNKELEIGAERGGKQGETPTQIRVPKPAYLA